MPSTAKQYSPAEIASLEHAFAADPASDAFRALTEAYLSMNRFMEAMVVCKKGVKAHPDDVSAKLLLARIYMEQGKDRKALDELQAALEAHPNDSLLNRTAGQLYMKLGQRDSGTAALKKAADAAPTDPEMAELLRKFGVAYTPAPPAPAPAPRPVAAMKPAAAAPPVAPRVAARSDAPAAAPAAAPRAARPVAAAPAPAPAEEEMNDLEVSVDEPGKPRGPRNAAYAEELAERYATQEFTLSTPAGRAARRKASGTFKTTIIMVVVLGAALVGYAGWSAKRKARDIEIDKLIKQARELIEKDTYKGYKDAAATCEQILEKDPDSVAGHAYLAYIDAIRSGEHGDGERVREEAKSHLDAARKLTDKHSHIFAADAYLRYYAGDMQGAIDELTDVLKKEADSGFLNGALGVILMQSGDLDAAKAALDKARRFADRDSRVNQMMAELFRRRGTGYETQAETSYGTVLRYTQEHVPSILGYAMMLLSAQRYDEALKGATKVLDMGEGASPRQVALADAVKASVLYAKGKPAEGAAEEQKALGLDSSNADIYWVIGHRKLRDGDPGGAAESLQKAISLDPRRQMFYVELTSALQQKEGGAKQAVDALSSAASRLPSDPRIARLLGDAYRAAHEFDQAQSWYQKAIDLAKPKRVGDEKAADDKGFPEAHLGLGRLYREKGDAANAQRELEQARKEYQRVSGAGLAEAEVELAELELGRDPNGAVAVTHFKAALEANPKSCPGLWGYGKLSFDRKLKDEAKRMLGSYTITCSRGPHAADAARLLASIK